MRSRLSRPSLASLAMTVVGALSAEAETGSAKESAIKQETGAPV
jgi:hypothetical protein